MGRMLGLLNDLISYVIIAATSNLMCRILYSVQLIRNDFFFSSYVKLKKYKYLLLLLTSTISLRLLPNTFVNHNTPKIFLCFSMKLAYVEYPDVLQRQNR